MARIIISTVGTVGDVVPFLALGQALRQRGHEIVVAVNTALHPLVRAAGLEAAACGPPYGPEQAALKPDVPDDLETPVQELKKWEALLTNVPAKYAALEAACKDADLLIAHSFHYAAMLVHNRLGIRWVCAALIPGHFRHYEHEASAQPAPRATMNLLASSLNFSQIDLDLYAHVAVTGFWYFDGAQLPDWQPTPDLRAFVEEGERPVVLCLGSLPGPDAAQTVAVAAAAAQSLQRKLVVQTGWTELPADAVAAGAHVQFARYLPHDWLFARADAVIHHGGIGVTARALKHGCPMLIAPYRKDQYFHATLVRALGVGFAMLPAKLTPAGMSRMLAERLFAEPVRAAAQECKDKLAAEDGLDVACQLIEDLLRGKPMLVG